MYMLPRADYCIPINFQCVQIVVIFIDWTCYNENNNHEKLNQVENFDDVKMYIWTVDIPLSLYYTDSLWTSFHHPEGHY